MLELASKPAMSDALGLPAPKLPLMSVVVAMAILVPLEFLAFLLAKETPTPYVVE